MALRAGVAVAALGVVPAVAELYISPIQGVSYPCAMVAATTLSDEKLDELHGKCADCDLDDCAETCIEDMYTAVAEGLKAAGDPDYLACLKAIPGDTNIGCLSAQLQIKKSYTGALAQCATLGCRSRADTAAAKAFDAQERAFGDKCKAALAGGSAPACLISLGPSLLQHSSPWENFFRDTSLSEDAVAAHFWVMTQRSRDVIAPQDLQTFETCLRAFAGVSPTCLDLGFSMASRTVRFAACPAGDDFCLMNRKLSLLSPMPAAVAPYMAKCDKIWHGGPRSEGCAAIVETALTPEESQRLTDGSCTAECKIDTYTNATARLSAEGKAMFEHCKQVFSGTAEYQHCDDELLRLSNLSPPAVAAIKNACSQVPILPVSMDCAIGEIVKILGKQWQQADPAKAKVAFGKCQAPCFPHPKLAR